MQSARWRERPPRVRQAPERRLEIVELIEPGDIVLVNIERAQQIAEQEPEAAIWPHAKPPLQLLQRRRLGQPVGPPDPRMLSGVPHAAPSRHEQTPGSSWRCSGRTASPNR